MGYNLVELLGYVNPSVVLYQDWLAVGMALKAEGYSAADWDAWSARDTVRYHPGECGRKWNGFQGSPSPVTGGTIVQLAKDHGWRPPAPAGRELSWNDVIGGKEDMVVVDANWLEGREITEPVSWNPAEELIRYLEILFDKSDYVGYVCESWEKDGDALPTKGCWDRTAEELIRALKKYKNDIGAALGDYNESIGAWIRFNPLDGKGVKDSNVTNFRYALVESDDITIESQNAMIRELELPVACLVFSGEKSLHAIVKIDAQNYDEYRQRVNYLYDICKQNGFKIDSQNRNASRLSRLPGAMRNGHKQFIVDTNFGKPNWTEWREWIEAANDDLPEPENMAAVWDILPRLSLPLIDGILRRGHKMLLAGPSKAGKSYALIQLCCSIAEGRPWFNWLCASGKVLYVNLELDRASCLHRFKDVYTALGWEPNNIANIDTWNLRGKAVPMDKLAPKLIRRAQKKNYIAIVIDPIYKVITGDENSADQMARFCNQFDRVCAELGAAVIYCHHHSKGQQGQKRSMDRASGSGVFARDPDVLLDLIELELNESVIDQETNKAVCGVCCNHLNRYLNDWEDKIGQDNMLSSTAMLAACRKLLTPDKYTALTLDVEKAKEAVKHYTAWRIEGTLREFPKFEPVNLWFNYPIHKLDNSGVLADMEVEHEQPFWKLGQDKRKQNAGEKRREINAELIDIVTEYRNMHFGDAPTIAELANDSGINVRTLQDRIKRHPTLTIDRNNNNIVIEIEPGQNSANE